MYTELQKLLRNDPDAMSVIEKKLGIKVRPHPKYPNLKMFKYDQINSPMGNPVVQECRGIVLDENASWGVVSYPFKKFFNHGEGHAAEIDWKSAKVQEKVDGSLMSLYFYDGDWHVASSGTPHAGGKAHDSDLTFAELFWKTWTDRGYSKPDVSFKHFTFCFELTTPHNRVVVPHHECNITLLGARNILTGEEVANHNFAGFDWQMVREFPLNSLESTLESLKSFEGIKQEGYVVVDDNFNRIKIKHPGYVAIHHMKGDDGPSYKKMLQIVLTGEGSELLTYFPEWTNIYNTVEVKLKAAVVTIEDDYQRCFWSAKHCFPPEIKVDPTRFKKEFSSFAVKTICPDALFKIQSGKIDSVMDYLRSIQPEHVMKIIGMRAEIHAKEE